MTKPLFQFQPIVRALRQLANIFESPDFSHLADEIDRLHDCTDQEMLYKSVSTTIEHLKKRMGYLSSQWGITPLSSEAYVMDKSHFSVEQQEAIAKMQEAVLACDPRYATTNTT